jgi:DNA-directed RNA polymerase subunit RPC12/RpoP
VRRGERVGVRGHWKWPVSGSEVCIKCGVRSSATCEFDICGELGYNSIGPATCFASSKAGGKVAAEMISQTVNCPQCDAPTALAVGQRHSQCPHCGSRFVVDWPNADAPQFTRFESVLERGLNRASAQVIEERLTELDSAIAEVEERVLADRAQLEDAKSAYGEKSAQVQRVIARPQNWTYVAGLLALLVWFLVWFVLEDIQWYVSLVIAIVLVFVTWISYRRWQGAEAWAQGELQGVKQTIERAGVDLIEASALLEDYTLERELREMQVSSHSRASALADLEDEEEPAA